MIEREDHDRLADKLDDEADELERESERLEEEIDDVRQDWKHKRADDRVAGAPPPDDEAEEDADSEAE